MTVLSIEIFSSLFNGYFDISTVNWFFDKLYILNGIIQSNLENRDCILDHEAELAPGHVCPQKVYPHVDILKPV